MAVGDATWELFKDDLVAEGLEPGGSQPSLLKVAGRGESSHDDSWGEDLTGTVCDC